MVRVQPRWGGGVRGKLSGDPAVTTAAVALLLGYPDPLGLLGLGRADYAIAVAAISKAADLKAEHETRLADYTAAQTANNLMPGLAKTIVAITRAMSRG